MDFNIEVRKKQLESLDQFISSSRDKVQSVLDALGWTASGVLKVKLIYRTHMHYAYILTIN